MTITYQLELLNWVTLSHLLESSDSLESVLWDNFASLNCVDIIKIMDSCIHCNIFVNYFAWLPLVTFYFSVLPARPFLSFFFLLCCYLCSIKTEREKNKPPDASSTWSFQSSGSENVMPLCGFIVKARYRMRSVIGTSNLSGGWMTSWGLVRVSVCDMTSPVSDGHPAGSAQVDRDGSVGERNSCLSVFCQVAAGVWQVQVMVATRAPDPDRIQTG